MFTIDSYFYQVLEDEPLELDGLLIFDVSSPKPTSKIQQLMS